MKDSNPMNYFWLGLAVGAALAAIFAPKSGADTRDFCQTKAHETGDALKRQAKELRGRVVRTIEDGKQGFQYQLRKFSAALAAGKSAFEKAA